jgi:hypothetical protein
MPGAAIQTVACLMIAHRKYHRRARRDRRGKKKTRKGLPDPDSGADISRCAAFYAVSASSAVIIGFGTV